MRKMPAVRPTRRHPPAAAAAAAVAAATAANDDDDSPALPQAYLSHLHVLRCVLISSLSQLLNYVLISLSMTSTF